jgi:hypothetical protein
LSQYKTIPFYNDWLDVSGMAAGNGKDHTVNLKPEFFEKLDPFNDKKLKQWRIDAATRCAESLGPFPALCFSGGIDSQAMLNCWAEADLEAHVIIFAFKDGLNKQDCEHAKQYCRKFDIPYREIEFDIVSFLTRDNANMTTKYGNISPHFNTHYRFVEILTHMGYTGVCFGGQAPDRNCGDYGVNISKVPYYWATCAEKFDIAVQGSFLSFSPELAWALTLSTPDIKNLDYKNNSTALREYDTLKAAEAEKYEAKLIGYRRVGFDLVPQPQKYTGFELVKDYFEEQTGDGWAFEKQFRNPLSKMNEGIYNKDPHQYRVKLSDGQQKALDTIYLKHFPSSD